MPMHFVFIKLSQATVLFPVLLGIINFKKLNKPFRILLFFFILSILFEIQASLLKPIYYNNMPGLHLFTVCEFIFLSLVYYYHFSKNSVLSRFIILNTCLFLLAASFDAFIINGILEPNNLSRTYSSISLVTMSLIFFYSFFKNDYEFYSWQYPMFWFNTGVLIYFALNLFYFMLNNYLVEHAYSIAYNSMRVHAAINIISNLLYAKSFLCFSKSVVRY